VKDPIVTKIILKGYMLIPDTDLDAVKKELPNHIQLTRQEEGCLVFNVFLDAKNPDRFNVYEDFLIAPHLNLIR
jgi:autoinducer 2-degrading protein